MTSDIPSPANPPERLLCGPGPCNVSPAALAALQKPLLGHMDPDFADILLEIVELQRIAYQASGGLVLPLQATGTSGMECGLSHLLVSEHAWPAALASAAVTVCVSAFSYFASSLWEFRDE